MNLTPVAAFCHPCDSGSNLLENASLLGEVGSSPWAFGRSQSNWGFSE